MQFLKRFWTDEEGFLEWLIPAGISLFGSLFGGAKRDEANAQAGAQNAALQREFAQNGIRWRVEDAKAAGLSPLAALGGSGASAQSAYVGDSGIGQALQSGSQDVSRAVSAGLSSRDRNLMSLQIAGAKADLDGKIIDNQIKATQLRKINSASPGMAGGDNFIPGQSNGDPLVVDQALKRTVSAPGRPAQEAGWRPDVAYARTDTGLTPVVPESLSESLEDDLIGKLLWRVRNQLVPNFTMDTKGSPPKSMLPRGYDYWHFNRAQQEWQPAKGEPLANKIDRRVKGVQSRYGKYNANF